MSPCLARRVREVELGFSFPYDAAASVMFITREHGYELTILWFYLGGQRVAEVELKAMV